MNPDGSNQTNISIGITTSMSKASWAPDGNTIVYITNGQICIMDSDGSNNTQLTSGGEYKYNPLWSPNSTLISFWTAVSGARQVFTIHRDGSGMTNLINMTNIEAMNGAWFPDGMRLAYSQNDRILLTNNQIYIMNSDGTNKVDISANAYGDNYPHVSPDGTKLAFISDRNGDTYPELWAMNADGTDQHIVSDTSTHIYDYYDWSPDSQYIVYCDTQNISDMYTVKADGTNRIFIESEAWGPDWN
jgi:Tol biopolymer transport system component